jgi:MFS family permease
MLPSSSGTLTTKFLPSDLRPAYHLVGFASAIGSATAKSFGTLGVARPFSGFGPSAALGLGAGTVVDIFYGRQKGKSMGVFTLMLTYGVHLAPIIRLHNFYPPTRPI